MVSTDGALMIETEYKKYSRYILKKNINRLQKNFI